LRPHAASLVVCDGIGDRGCSDTVIALDTNVLVRYVVQDDPDQAAASDLFTRVTP
jgi:hypothetical protein